MKTLAFMALATLLGACSANISTNTPTTEPKRPAAKPFSGQWVVAAKSCNGLPASTSGRPVIRIDPTATYLAYITVTEEDSTHLCKQSEIYRLLATNVNHGTDSVGRATDIHTGYLKKLMIRRTCHRRTSGGVDPTPYADQTHEVQDVDRRAELQQTNDDSFSLRTDHSDFCPTGQAVFVLKRI